MTMLPLGESVRVASLAFIACQDIQGIKLYAGITINNQLLRKIKDQCLSTYCQTQLKTRMIYAFEIIIYALH